MERLRHQNIVRSTPPHVPNKMLKTDVNTERGIFHLNHLPPQGLCPLQRTTFYIISPTVHSYLCVNFSVHIPKNTQRKCFSEISWLCRAFWNWCPLVVPCWLRIPWQLLISASSSQTTTSDVYDSILHVGISRNKAALKMPKTIAYKYSSRGILVNVSDTWFSHPLLWTNICLQTSLVWETKQHKGLIWTAPALARPHWCLEMISWRQPPISLPIWYSLTEQQSNPAFEACLGVSLWTMSSTTTCSAEV